MEKLFAGKTAVVTGGTSGLGLALAQTFLQHGAYVYLLARDHKRLDQVADRLRHEYGPTGTLVADVTSDTQVEAAFAQVRQERGGLQVLINAAGKSQRGAILGITPEQFQELWDLNFLGTVRCTRAAANDLISAGGHLINIGSLASKIASVYLGAYPASKFAVAAYSQQLRLELSPRGLHVLLVCPGPLQRNDAGHRYDDQTVDLPSTARRPGGGAGLKAIDPMVLGQRVVRACQLREHELVIPTKARWLAAIMQMSPAWGDWILRRQTQ